MNPATLHFSRAGNAGKALFFLGFAALAVWLAFELHREGREPPRPLPFPGVDLPMPAPARDPWAAFKIPLLIGAGGLGLYYAGRSLWRGSARDVAVKLEDGRVLFHPSYGVSAFRVEDITAVQFDRSDRLPDSDAAGLLRGYSITQYWGVKLGARAHHGLYLGYRSGASDASIALSACDFDGGKEQLRRFAELLDTHRRARVRALR